MASRYPNPIIQRANGVQAEIVILIDTSAFQATDCKDDVIDHVKESISFQISRGAITNRKLLRLGLEPCLGRVKWTYLFFDSTKPYKQGRLSATSEMIAQSCMKKLSYECWELFKEKLIQQVRKRKASTSSSGQTVPDANRMKNVVDTLRNLKFPYNLPGELRNSNPDLTSTCAKSEDLHKMEPYSEKFIIVYTQVPKLFSSLIHLALGISSCKSAISSAANCSPCDIQICFVDVTFDSIPIPENSDVGDLPTFWDDLCITQKSSLETNQACSRTETVYTSREKLNLRVACFKKIMTIHKLVEIRFAWMYNHSLPFGLGPGMKILRQWDWRINKQPITTRIGCLSSLRKCYSEDMY